MNTEEILNLAHDVVTAWDWTSKVSRPSPDRLDVTITSMAELVPVMVGLRVKRLGFLSAIVGLDPDPAAHELEVLYIFSCGSAVISLRVRLPREEPVLPTLSDILPVAEPLERELSEMFGIQIRSPFPPAHLCLPESWPNGLYPLRKEVSLQNLPAAGKPRTAFQFTVDDGLVTGAQLRLEDNRWLAEKSAEVGESASNLSLLEGLPGVCSQAHALAYSLAVERLYGLQVPPRARSLRVLAAELERVHSHLLWLAGTARETGMETLFADARADAETTLALLTTLSTGPLSIPGGVRADMDLNQGKTILAGLPALETRTRHYLDIVTNDAIFQQHTRNVGVMTRAQAEVLGVVGPLARAAGVPRDVRVEAPGAVYGTEPVTLTQESNGDLEARFKVHVRELSESLRLARLQLDNLQQGPISVPLTGNPPAGEAVVRVEAPEGELFYFLQSDGSPALARLKVRTPGERNLAACLRLTVGHPLKDVPVSLAGAFAERTGMERSVYLRNVVAGWERSVRWEELG